MNESNLESVMGLIMYGGEAKSNAMEAIQAAKKVISLKPIED
ncbi:lichenan-specific phosphotransferase enzyme iia component (pts system lichenan-specific eiia component) (eiia-lic) (eiii-lic) [Streptococcus pneumoniae]|nr:lichenan-specific phosphotransferase enzyme iia component (pts system lichenan-specific eiia component) (eiia-lic) (eiii-lic) [Streptococcus pneumoniae]VIX88115.1 lichenan-specific phosphotransferase enzyme iia component (pts system lichenan-specific eiia component) (eiia-lic) (eiii-lic) [Streptococcus pneumoniae]